MIASKEVELLDNSQVKLKVTISGEEIKREYDELVSKISKNASLRGFRRGKVPHDVLIRKLGPSLIEEARAKVLEKSLAEVLETVEQKPLAYRLPEIQSEGKLEPGKEYSFEVRYDTYPTVELGQYKGLSIEEPVVEVTDDDVGSELKALQEQNALVVEKEPGEKAVTVEKGDVVNIDYCEVDATGAEAKNTKREAFVFEVGTGYNLYRMDDDIIGMQKGETKRIKKTYPEDFEAKDLAGRSVDLTVTVNSIKEKKLPELNDELAQDINEKFATLEDLKSNIRKSLEETAKNSLRQGNISRLIQKIVANTKVPLPKSMVDYESEIIWRDYMARLGVAEKVLVKAIENDGKTVEQFKEQWKPQAEGRAKQKVVIAEIAKKEGISITDEELEEDIRKRAEDQKVSPEELKDRLAKNNLMGYVKNSLALGKLYDFLLSKTTIAKGGKINLLDLVRGNY